MKTARLIFCLLAPGAPMARATGDFFDNLGSTLTVASANRETSAKLSGTFDLEVYRLESPAPGLLYTPDETLLNPRLTLFLDAQAGHRWYFFAQVRVDRGFDPAKRGLEVRADEYALRHTPWEDGRLSVQVGKFATVAGNWVLRHGSWANAFVTAPLAYEELTGIWDSAAARTAGILIAWAHAGPASPSPGSVFADKHLRVPMIWGPAYSSGLALMGETGRLSYAAEIKNGALSSRPEAWTPDRDSWRHPSVGARVGFRPNVMWNLGISGSRGVYLRPSAMRLLPAGFGLSDYRQTVLGWDAGFAWRHWQVWTEVYHARFEVPRVGNADTLASYVEAKYKFAPQFSGAVRLNRQTFGRIPLASGQTAAWGRDVWRLDVAPAYRFTAHVQLKLQYSLQEDAGRAGDPRHFFAGQCTVRF